MRSRARLMTASAQQSGLVFRLSEGRLHVVAAGVERVEIRGATVAVGVRRGGRAVSLPAEPAGGGGDGLERVVAGVGPARAAAPAGGRRRASPARGAGESGRRAARPRGGDAAVRRARRARCGSAPAPTGGPFSATATSRGAARAPTGAARPTPTPGGAFCARSTTTFATAPPASPARSAPTCSRRSRTCARARRSASASCAPAKHSARWWWRTAREASARFARRSISTGWSCSRASA